MIKRVYNPTTSVKFKCPECSSIHSVADWHKTTRKRYSSFRRLPNPDSRYICPKCTSESRGHRLIKVVCDLASGKEVEACGAAANHFCVSEE